MVAADPKLSLQVAQNLALRSIGVEQALADAAELLRAVPTGG